METTLPLLTDRSPRTAAATIPTTNFPAHVNKTISPSDLELPAVANTTQRLTELARQLWWKRVPFAVNGVLRMRWRRIRWNKLWEYSRGLTYGDFAPGMRVLDFGGGATIPIFYLASQGCDVFSLDIDAALTAHTNTVAQIMNWPLRGSTFDLTAHEPTVDRETYDRIISFCVIEHLPKDRQLTTLARLGRLLKPNGLLELTFDYGKDAPVEGAIRSMDEVREMVQASGLIPQGDGEFHDTGERFVIDQKYPDRHFTFGSLFLRKL